METDGITAVQAQGLAGITYRQLDYWVRKGWVTPSIDPGRGKSSRRLFAVDDVVRMGVLCHLGRSRRNLTELGPQVAPQAVEGTILGQHRFKGRIFHSQNWPDDYTGAGDRIAVVGSGSSALQIVPATQPLAKSVTVFQRSPTWIMPKNERLFSEAERAEHEGDISIVWAERERWDQTMMEAARGDLGLDPAWRVKAEETARRFLEDEVPDPELRKLLTPDHNYGCKRIGISDSWFKSLQADNVELVPEAAAEIDDHTIISKSGKSFEVDAIVLAIGYRWGTQILERIYRRDGLPVAEAQGGHPSAYKSVNIAQCPNLFLIGGPAPNGRAKHCGLQTGEMASVYLTEMMRYMKERNISALEVTAGAETRWKDRADEILSNAMTTTGECTSYTTDKCGHNMSDWPGDAVDQRNQLSQVIPEDYIEPPATAPRDHSG